MGLKDNLKAVKNELNTEEQFIENFIKGERFIRKYKFYRVRIKIIKKLVRVIIKWQLIMQNLQKIIKPFINVCLKA